MLEAVKYNCTALKYASLELQNDHDVVFEAIKLGTPSFMGKANDENILSRSLEDISNHLFLFDSNDLNFLYVCKWNFTLLEREVNSMGWHKKMFSSEARHLRTIRGIYRERIGLFMKRIREDDEYNKKQKEIELEETRKKEKYENYLRFRTRLEQMPMYERWRENVIIKCGNKCQLDKTHADRHAEVHHIDSLYSIYLKNNLNSDEEILKCKKLWDIDNGIVLCKECHDTMESSQNRQTFLLNNKQKLK
jgi:hypothetical protein